MTLCNRCGQEFSDFCKPCAAQVVVRALRRKGILRSLVNRSKQSRQARARALIELNDSQLAIKVALRDADAHLRRAALMLVRDKEVLMEVIYTDEDWRVRQVAIRCLRDEELLKEVMKDFAKESTNYRFAEECLANLTNR